MFQSAPAPGEPRPAANLDLKELPPPQRFRLPRSNTLLLLVASIFALVLFFIIDADFSTEQRLENPLPEGFYSSVISDNAQGSVFSELVLSYRTAETKEEQIDYLRRIFNYLNMTYSTAPTVQLRLEMEKLADFIRTKFPGDLEKFDLRFYCIDEACSNYSNYPNDVKDISEILLALPLDDAVKADFKSKFALISDATDEDGKSVVLNTLVSVYFTLRDQYLVKNLTEDQFTKSSSVVLAYLENASPDTFEQFEKDGRFKVE